MKSLRSCLSQHRPAIYDRTSPLMKEPATNIGSCFRKNHDDTDRAVNVLHQNRITDLRQDFLKNDHGIFENLFSPLQKTVTLGIALLFLLGFSSFCVAAPDPPNSTAAFNSYTNTVSTPSKPPGSKSKNSGSAEIDTAPVPEDLRPFEAPLAQGHLLGDWATVRTNMEDHGITPSVTFETDLAGNVSGGRSTGFAEADNLGLNLVFDLKKLADIPGATFLASAAQRSGSSLSQDRIGNVFSVQQVYGGETFHLIDLAWQQELLNDRVEVVMGRIAAGDDFLVSVADYLWMQNAFDGNPVGIFFNAPGMTAYPAATWGARVKIRPTPRSYLMGGIYNGDPSIRSDAYHGANFTLHGPLYVMGEGCYQINGLPGDSLYRGDYKVGFWYDNSVFTDYNTVGYGTPSSTIRGGWGVYSLFDQVIFPFGTRASQRGLAVFGSVIATTREDISQMPWFFTFGFICRGAFSSRPTDLMGVAVAYGQFSGDLFDAESREHIMDPTIDPQTHESVIEASYRFRFDKNSLFFQPNVQYVINPGGTEKYNNALVLGCQIGVNF